MNPTFGIWPDDDPAGPDRATWATVLIALDRQAIQRWRTERELARGCWRWPDLPSEFRARVEVRRLRRWLGERGFRSEADAARWGVYHGR